MSDWGAHLGRGRKLAETAAWIGAGSAVALCIAASAALATWFDRREGDGMAQTILIDLPPIEAVADAPSVQPEASAEMPENTDAPETDAPPEEPQEIAEDLPEPEQPDLPPPEEMADALPDTTPPPEPEPEPVKPPEVVLPKPKPAEVKEPKPKTEKKQAKAEKPAEKKPTEEKPREAKARKSQASQAASASGGSAAGSATPSEMAKWKSRVQQALAKHMRRKSYGYRGNVTLVIYTSGSGQVTKVELSSSTGNSAADAALRNQAARAKLPPSPRGAAEVLTLPISLR